MTKSEKEESFTIVAHAVEEHCPKHFKLEYRSCTRLLTLSDAHRSYRNTYTILAAEESTSFSKEITAIGIGLFNLNCSIGMLILNVDSECSECFSRGEKEGAHFCSFFSFVPFLSRQAKY